VVFRQFILRSQWPEDRARCFTERGHPDSTDIRRKGSTEHWHDSRVPIVDIKAFFVGASRILPCAVPPARRVRLRTLRPRQSAGTWNKRGQAAELKEDYDTAYEDYLQAHNKAPRTCATLRA